MIYFFYPPLTEKEKMKPFPFDSHGTTKPLMRFSRNTRGELCILTYIVAAAMDSHGYKLETECKFIAKKKKKAALPIGAEGKLFLIALIKNEKKCSVGA